MYTSKIKLNQFFILSIIALFLSSCVTRKEVVHFQNAKDFETIVNTDTFTAKLKVGDIVSIYVSVLTLPGQPSAAEPYNLVLEGGLLVDYLIDVDGNIDFPILGKIKLLGLTVEEAKQLFKKKFKEGDLLQDPVIIIRILNFRIVVDGEVNSPGVYSANGERVSVLEALAMAGGLTIKGRRDNVLVVRDFNGAKTYSRIDLTSKEVFSSPVYYLTQNDHIYVEPNNSSISGASGDSRISTIIAISSFILTTALIFVTRN